MMAKMNVKSRKVGEESTGSPEGMPASKSISKNYRNRSGAFVIEVAKPKQNFFVFLEFFLGSFWRTKRFLLTALQKVTFFLFAS